MLEENSVVAVPDSPSSHASVSVYKPKSDSFISSESISFGIFNFNRVFWQGEMPGGAGMFQEHGEQAPVLICGQ